MAIYLTVTTDGYEVIHDTRPTRKISTNWVDSKMWYNHTGHYMIVPNGTIRNLIGKDITFEDGPINLNKNKIY